MRSSTRTASARVTGSARSAGQPPRAWRARPRSAWLGLTPILSQSGESAHRGGIMKTGSTLARRLLVESAWHYARTPGVGAALVGRQDGQGPGGRGDREQVAASAAQGPRRTRARGSPATSSSSRWPASCPASSGPPPPTNRRRQRSTWPVGRGVGPHAAGTRDSAMSSRSRPQATGAATLVPRQREPAARTIALGYPTPASSDWQRRQRARRPDPPEHGPPGRRSALPTWQPTPISAVRLLRGS
ncbi:hypothetical protein DSM112329_00180 [Paraconexibacter sp. AEG42_29]|uniref:Transposase IS116/IS110/IS902 C-terminal domain-containing protein n=1 Tax=Paraconexibacter sp. AEG42_29 TaxID=2997339 RepID=A0AAU7AP70_9ACTN